MTKQAKTININPDFSSNPKQGLALKYLMDQTTTDVAYGGSAGNGKSFLGCAWLIAMCIRYPGTRWLMGRAKLKALTETTLVTFMDVCQQWQLEAGVHYQYNAKSNVIAFGKDYGGSVILLKDLFAYPSDPEFDSLGSLEITGVFCDEAAQITAKAREIVRSRIRYKLDNFCPKCGTMRTVPLDQDKKWNCSCGIYTGGLIPKMLMTCNPAKNWMYSLFYKPWKDGTLPANMKFIPALARDNKHIQATYLENLNALTGTNRERLLNGSWEYETNDWTMIDFDAIQRIFGNKVKDGQWMITADIARQGRDKTVVCVWNGLNAVKFYTLDKNTIPEAVDLIKKAMKEWGVHEHNCWIDQDGVGGGVVDSLPDSNGIVNNAPAIFVDACKENFGNLKSQLYYWLSEYVNKGMISICINDDRDKISEELEWCRRKDGDNDGKYYVLPKQTIKENLGRSPDHLDVLAFRMLPEISDGALYL